jgi:hypothetical protein
MPAGDLLAQPGDIEWEGTLLSVTGPDASGYWLTSVTERSGWHPTWAASDLSTEQGVAPGKAIRDGMYPTLIGVAVETAELLNDLIDLMDVTESGSLSWWDPARDLRLSVTAWPRRAEPSTAAGIQHYRHRLVDLMWVVPRSGLIVDLDGGS